jgi:hypothetical protein
MDKLKNAGFRTGYYFVNKGGEDTYAVFAGPYESLETAQFVKKQLHIKTAEVLPSKGLKLH